jgi:hypothetical protein
MSWLRRHSTPLLAIAYMLAAALAVLLFDTTKTDLDVFFWPSAEVAAHGHLLLVYGLHSATYPNANGPVSLLPLSLVAALANLLGWQDVMRWRDALTVGLFTVFTVLLAREAVLAIERGRGQPTRRLLAAAVFLLGPPLWVALVGFGHVEEPLELWLILLGVRLLGDARALLAGICVGLAVMTRSASAVCLIPLLAALLFDRRWRAAAALSLATVLTVAVVVAPFLVADRSDVVFSLVTYRGALPIVGGSLWVAFAGAEWAGFVQHADTLIFAGAAAALSVAALAWRPHEGWASPRVYALLAMASACVPMLAKTSWPYYLLDPYVFAALWWLAGPGRVVGWRASATLLLAALGTVLAAVEPTLPLPAASGAVVGVVASAGMAVAIGLILAGWWSRPRPRVQAASPPGPAGGGETRRAGSW